MYALLDVLFMICPTYEAAINGVMEVVCAIYCD